MTSHRTAIVSDAGQWLKPSEIARDLRLSAMTVYRLIEVGELPAVRIGRSLRVSRKALDDYLAGAAEKASA